MDLRQEVQISLTQSALLHRIANRIRQSLELQEILSTTVAEVRDYLGTDRVKIYQFQPDGHGLVIAESLRDGGLPPLLGLHFPADDIPFYARELFVRSRQRSIVDLTTHEIGISPLLSLQTGEIVDDPDIAYRPVDPCHVEYLTAMGVKSSVVVPIIIEQQATGKAVPSLSQSSHLWGLLVSHHAAARRVTTAEVQFIQSVVDQVAVAIAQSILLEQVRSQAKQEAIINRVTKLLYAEPTTELQAALEETVAAFNGSGGRLYLLPDEDNPFEIYTCGTQPTLLDQGRGRPIEEHRLWQKYLLPTPASVSGGTPATQLWSVAWMRAVYDLKQLTTDSSLDCWAIADIYKEPLLRTIAPCFRETEVRGMVIVPLRRGEHVLGCLTIFRDGIDVEMMWAGYVDTDSRQLIARQSFEAWREFKTGQAQQWTEAEMRLAQAIAERFATAIKQYRLYQHVKALNASLEKQVSDRTAELSQTIEHLKQAQTQLIQSEKMSSLGQLVAGIAHEINNPVNFIHGNLSHMRDYTETLVDLLKLYQQQYPEPEPAIQTALQTADLEFLLEDLPRLFTSLEVGAVRIRDIVLSLRNFSRLDQAAIKRVDVHEGIDSTLLILQHRLKPNSLHSGIRLIQQYGELPLVECFAGQLNQVFMNLLSNAIDAVEARIEHDAKCGKPRIEPEIVIQSQVMSAVHNSEAADQDCVQIAIQDNGLGVSEAVKARLFDPFFTTKPIGKGTGLGLSISYQIVEKHGGKLWCESQSGMGTTFYVKIPLKLAMTPTPAN